MITPEEVLNLMLVPNVEKFTIKHTFTRIAEEINDESLVAEFFKELQERVLLYYADKFYNFCEKHQEWVLKNLDDDMIGVPNSGVYDYLRTYHPGFRYATYETVYKDKYDEYTVLKEEINLNSFFPPHYIDTLKWYADYMKQRVGKAQIPVHYYAEMLERLQDNNKKPDLSRGKTITEATEPGAEEWELPEKINTERVRKYFARAVEAGYMTRTNTGYKWNKKKVELGYFVYLIFCPNNVGTIPQKCINKVFGCNRLDTSISQINFNSPRPWMQEMKERIFFDDPEIIK